MAFDFEGIEDSETYPNPTGKSKKNSPTSAIRLGKFVFPTPKDYPGYFFQGPCDLDWFLGCIPDSVGRVVVCLWFIRGIYKSNSFSISHGDLASLVDRTPRTAKRALDTLASLGRITVVREPGQKSHITLHTSFPIFEKSVPLGDVDQDDDL